MNRRRFLTATAGAGSLAFGASPLADESPATTEPVIDIHQHLSYGGKRDKEWNLIEPGRNDTQFLAHQRAMGITRTILLPSGRSVLRPSTHEGRSNGLEATCDGNERCYRFALEHSKEFSFGANEVTDLPEAPGEIEKYLKLGAVVIGEQKFGVDCDSADSQRLYALAADYKVPILMHWQFQDYNYGFERFYKILEKFPKTNFIGHAQTWWANIDRDHIERSNLYPKTGVRPGGITDRYLSDYPNIFGDLSAGSGLNSLIRDEDQTREFLTRHQDKLLLGTDCADTLGRGPGCEGAQIIAAIRRLAPSKQIERKLFHDNSQKLFRL
ncbi:MAG TPA: amidohydrolase family protein [Candidatus Limnocylindria bacterium]|nr:amidohydrolase family protein [Candidatus Limnocylindria bacterium]